MREYLKKIEEVIAAGPYKDTWESLQEYEVPKWYRNAKFGIFIHWGVYSVPAFGSEWYPRNMYIQGSPEYEHHIGHTERIRNSDTRILYQCLKLRILIRQRGRTFF